MSQFVHRLPTRSALNSAPASASLTGEAKGDRCLHPSHVAAPVLRPLPYPPISGLHFFRNLMGWRGSLRALAPSPAQRRCLAVEGLAIKSLKETIDTTAPLAQQLVVE